MSLAGQMGPVSVLRVIWFKIASSWLQRTYSAGFQGLGSSPGNVVKRKLDVIQLNSCCEHQWRYDLFSSAEVLSSNGGFAQEH